MKIQSQSSHFPDHDNIDMFGTGPYLSRVHLYEVFGKIKIAKPFLDVRAGAVRTTSWMQIGVLSNTQYFCVSFWPLDAQT